MKGLIEMNDDWMSGEEKALLFVCAKEKYKNAVEKLVSQNGIDIKKLENMCVSHRLYPQFVDAILHSPLKGLVNESQLKEYEEEQKLMKLNFLLYKKEVLRIQKLMDDAQIKMLVIKGITYYPYFYEHMEQRQLGDIDIVVEKRDLVGAIHVLQGNGYMETRKNRGWSDDMYLEETNETLHVAQLSNSRFEVEVHIATYYYTGLNLKNIIDRSYIKDGIRVPDERDIFLIACVHAWHHFPIRKNPLITHFIKIGHLLDVYVCFSKLQSDDYYDVLKYGQNESVLGIVETMVYISFRLFDDKKNPIEISNKIKNFIDWNFNSIELPIEFRYLRPIETYNILEENYKNTISEITKINNSSNYNSDVFVLQYSSGKISTKYANEVLETGVIDPIDLPVLFSVNWEKEAFVFYFEFPNDIIWNQSLRRFDFHSSYIILRIGEKYENEPCYIVIQLIDNYLKTFMWEMGREWFLTPKENKKIQSSFVNNKWQIRIPIQLLDFRENFVGKTIYFDVQAHLVKRREYLYTDISWSAGNCGCMWNEIRNCSYLQKALLC